MPGSVGGVDLEAVGHRGAVGRRKVITRRDIKRAPCDLLISDQDAVLETAKRGGDVSAPSR